MRSEDFGDGWEVRVEERPVVRLYKDGLPVVDERGRPHEYASVEEAREVALRWEQYRAPTIAELRSLTDENLRREIDAVMTTGHRLPPPFPIREVDVYSRAPIMEDHRPWWRFW